MAPRSHTLLALSLACWVGVEAQQMYVPVEGATARPSCSAPVLPVSTPMAALAEPEYRFSPFNYSTTTTLRTATSVQAPSTTTAYAPPYDSLSQLVPSLSTTTWGSWDPSSRNTSVNATASNEPYGQAAWSALWQKAPLPANLTRSGLYTATVEPTPVPTEQLVLPPRDYFGPEDCYHFPHDFVFGVAGSAAQIEGAVWEEGKSPSLMEVIAPLKGSPDNFVTNENYYLYKQDIERLASIGVKHYSFSMSWTRILPFARPGTPVNQQGIDHYNHLIDFVIAKGMVPIVTMLHFDTPMQFISDPLSHPRLGFTDGGYGSKEFEDAFVHYGRILMTHFADRVPYWATFNEPLLYSNAGASIYHVIKAHARIWHFYHEEIGGKGQVGLKLNNNFGVPKDPANKDHVVAAEWFNSIQLGPFANPIMLGIDYPESFKTTVPDYVPLNASELAYLNGTADYFGIDPYTATVISPLAEPQSSCTSNTSHPAFPYCVTQETTTSTGWNIGYRSYSYVFTTPTYLRQCLNYLWNTFKKPVFITEFGFPVFGEADKERLQDQLFDSPRSIYYLSFMSEVLKAIWDDGVRVVGALAWSYADNWEFGDYNARFGLQTVNRTTMERRYKKSLFDLVDFVQARTPRE